MRIVIKVIITSKNGATSINLHNLIERLPVIVAEELSARYGTELECGNVDPEGISLRIRQ